jgi:hypothetical protein
MKSSRLTLLVTLWLLSVLAWADLIEPTRVEVDEMNAASLGVAAFYDSSKFPCESPASLLIEVPRTFLSAEPEIATVRVLEGGNVVLEFSSSINAIDQDDLGPAFHGVAFCVSRDLLPKMEVTVWYSSDEVPVAYLIIRDVERIVFGSK